ncbi:MAG TPA: AsmA family protein, partial [Flavitalea sp.]|nr:AsmA family protein [Flavitalea sp.]
MNKVFKTIGLVISALVLLIAICWIGVAIFVTYNKEYLRNKLVEIIEKRTGAKAEIKEVSSSILKTFPFVSVQISGISLRDSMYSQHHHDLFHAEQVFLRASPASLITRKRIGKILIRSGSLYLLTDSSGYTNNYVLKGKPDAEKKEGSSLPDISLESFQVELANLPRNKHYKGFVSKLDCSIDDDGTGRKDIKLKADLQVAGIGFNTRKGYFIKDTRVRSTMRVLFNEKEESLHFTNLVLNLNDEPVTFTGNFDLGRKTQDFSLDITAPKANYSRLVKFLPAKLQKLLNRYSITSPVELSVHVVGKTSRNVEPRVTAQMIARGNDVSVPDLDLTDCSFTAVYDNQKDSTKEISDANSIITFTDVKAKYA